MTGRGRQRRGAFGGRGGDLRLEIGRRRFQCAALRGRELGISRQDIGNLFNGGIGAVQTLGDPAFFVLATRRQQGVTRLQLDPYFAIVCEAQFEGEIGLEGPEGAAAAADVQAAAAAAAAAAADA